MVSRELRLSPRYINRLFETEDTSLSRYIWRRRLERTAENLRDPTLRCRSISLIAMDNGFNDLSHFSKAFRLRFDLSPREYRSQSAMAPSARRILIDRPRRGKRCTLAVVPRVAMLRSETVPTCNRPFSSWVPGRTLHDHRPRDESQLCAGCSWRTCSLPSNVGPATNRAHTITGQIDAVSEERSPDRGHQDGFLWVSQGRPDCEMKPRW